MASITRTALSDGDPEEEDEEEGEEEVRLEEHEARRDHSLLEEDTVSIQWSCQVVEGSASVTHT